MTLPHLREWGEKTLGMEMKNEYKWDVKQQEIFEPKIN